MYTTQLPVFGCLLLVLRGLATDTVKSSSACYGSSPCNLLNLSCSDGRGVFLLEAGYGYQPVNSNCSGGVAGLCPDTSPCCRPIGESCTGLYSEDNFGGLLRTCWNQSQCRINALIGDGGCYRPGGPGYNRYSSYAEVTYTCLGANETLPFTSPGDLIAPTVVTEHTRGGGIGTWQCRVESGNSSPRPIRVILVRAGGNSATGPCSSLGINGLVELPCGTADLTYTSITVNTSFSVYLTLLGNDSFIQGWAVMAATDGSTLTVTCGVRTVSSTGGPGNVTTQTAIAMVSSTSSAVSGSTTSDTTSSTPMREDLTANDQTSLTDSTTSAMSRSTSSEAASPAYLNTSSAGNMEVAVGVSVGVVLAVVLAGVAVFFYIRRRRSKPPLPDKALHPVGSPKPLPMTSLNGAASPSIVDGNSISNSPGDTSELYHVVEGQSPSVIYSDYDALGSRKQAPSSVSPGELYGRLNISAGSDVTENAYDRTRRTGNVVVLDSDYDVTRPNMTSDDYDTTAVTASNHVTVIDSPYDMAPPPDVTAGDGEYSATNRLLRKREVIGSEYDRLELSPGIPAWSGHGATPVQQGAASADGRLAPRRVEYELAKQLE